MIQDFRLLKDKGRINPIHTIRFNIGKDYISLFFDNYAVRDDTIVLLMDGMCIAVLPITHKTFIKEWNK